VTLEELITTAY